MILQTGSNDVTRLINNERRGLDTFLIRVHLTIVQHFKQVLEHHAVGSFAVA